MIKELFTNRAVKKNISNLNSSNIDNVNINKDGIVSLNLKSEMVQKKVRSEIDKLRHYSCELKRK